MSKLDKDQVLSDFTEAYTKVNGKEPQIEAKSGWYSIDGGKNIRLAAIVDMTAELAGGAAPAAKEEKPAAKAQPAKKAAPKAKKAPTAKAEPKSAFTLVKKGDGEKPANFWLTYLESLGHDCRAPHGFY